MINKMLLEIPYLLLGEQLCVHHLDLDRYQSERIKGQAPSVSVVVLHAPRREHKQKDFPHQNITTDQTKERTS